MKKLLFLFVLLFAGLTNVFAQVPVNEQLTYQTVVRNAQNQLVSGQDNVTVTVEVCNIDGSAVRYSEKHTGLSTNANGLLTLMVGGGTPLSGTWADIDWSDAAIRITLSYDPGTGTVTIPSGLAPVSAVPYALQAGNTGNITNIIGDAIHDSIVNNISIQIHDSVSNYLDNNDYVKESDLCTAIETNCTNVALRDGNTFRGEHDFTGADSVTVPDAVTPDFITALSTACTKEAVNLCDLFAMFDSVTRRIDIVLDSLQLVRDEIDELKNAVPPTADAPTMSEVTFSSMKATAHATSTGAAITSYEFCISTNPDMSGSTCHTVQASDADNYTFTGLSANTDYYVQYKATNFVGTATSPSVLQRTPAHEPPAGVTLSVSQTGTGSLTLCGNSSGDVTYTATPSDGGSYTYSWSGTPASVSDSIATYTYSSANTYNIIVTATHTTEGYVLTATTSTAVNKSTAVTIGLCESEGIVTVKTVKGSPNSIDWGDGQTGTSVSTSTTHDYSTTFAPGLHSVTITASNAGGCSFNRTMTVNVLVAGSTAADRTVKPCTAGSHAAQTDGAYMGNGYSGANHGLETVNGEGKITSVTDYDGNAYPVVQIGSQCWLAENLRCSHSPKTGSNIVVSAVLSSVSKMAAWYNNDRATYEAKHYGLLYNWCALMDTAKPSNGSYTYVEVAATENIDNGFDFIPSGHHQGICPTGWHVPTDAEWSTMESEVNGSALPEIMGDRGRHASKLSTSCDWSSSVNNGAPGDYANVERNESGFSALPTGFFHSIGSGSGFSHAGASSTFGSVSTRYSGEIIQVLVRGIDWGIIYVNRSIVTMDDTMSVRCVRD